MHALASTVQLPWQRAVAAIAVAVCSLLHCPQAHELCCAVTHDALPNQLPQVASVDPSQYETHPGPVETAAEAKTPQVSCLL